MDLEGITNAALLSLQAWGPGAASHALSTTGGRDVLTATARRADNMSLGPHVVTTYDLNGEWVSAKVAGLLLQAYGKGSAS